MRVTPEMKRRALLRADDLVPEVGCSWDDDEERSHDVDVIVSGILEAALADVPEPAPLQYATDQLAGIAVDAEAQLAAVREVVREMRDDTGPPDDVEYSVYDVEYVIRAWADRLEAALGGDNR